MSPTRIVILSCLAVLIVYDIWALSVHGYDWTISQDMYTFAKQFPIAPMGLGVVFGHLYWPNASDKRRLAKLLAAARKLRDTSRWHQPMGENVCVPDDVALTGLFLAMDEFEVET